MKLAGKSAFVTGGSGGIGSACAKALLQDGAAVTIMGRRKDALEITRKELLAEIPKGVIEIYAGDAQSAEDVQAALKVAHGMQGRLDVIASTVGAAAFRPILMHTAETFREALDINIITAFLAVRYGAPLMDHGGSIICVSSTAAKLTFAWLAAYHTAKGGLENFVKAAAEELGAAGIRVNSIRPGLVRNAPDKALFTNPALLAPWVEQTPLRQRVPGQLCENDDIGAAVRFLAGPESAWVTGQSFAVDGGLELRKNPDMTSSTTHLFGETAMQAIRKGKSPA
jgi:NAD(P)-dependent dehydrogenase (short-subunit alcohol dehydrogenase family)